MLVNANATDIDLEVTDLGPLAWVLEELRKSLDASAKAVKRFVRDNNLARGSADGSAPDTAQLRLARTQLHQAVGALQMVGLAPPAHVLLSMEGAVQRFIDKPALCTDDVAQKLERTSFALVEYLEGVLAGKPVSPLGLFAHYRDVQQAAGADRIHPADLWPMDWQWREVALPGSPAPRAYEAATRARLDAGLLKLIKGDPSACADLAAVCAGLAVAQTVRQPATFWAVAAGFFEGLALSLVPVDLYVKRAASRILLQYTTLSRGDQSVSDRLANDLLFFCAQAVPPTPTAAPVLHAVRLSYGLARFTPVNYEQPQFGRYDPAILTQARKRVAGAKDSWTSLTGGDLGKMRAAVDQFGLVSDSLLKLHPASAPLAHALVRTLDAVQRGGETPSTELAMEVATSVLFLEAAFDDLDLDDPRLAERTLRLAERLEAVRAGARSQALESWMEELYRRVSDRQTMGSVVGELRGSLGELEKSLDQYFRQPEEKGILRDVPAQLAQMRGVLSVLGLDQAAQAVLGMRDAIENLLLPGTDAEQARAAGVFDKLGNNLGALGFLIDMLNYQPVLAKKLFVHDARLGELKPLMGRVGHAAEQSAPAVAVAPDLLAAVAQPQPDAQPHVQTMRLDKLAIDAALAGQAELAQNARQAAQAITAQDTQAASAALSQLSVAAAPPATPAPAPALAPQDDIEEDDLLDIFLEEAREVVLNGQQALKQLALNPADLSLQTTLRRAFHTLKGSSRMVGLNEYGEAAWAMEQLFNAWLAEPRPLDAAMRQLAGEAMDAFDLWTGDIEEHTDEGWSAEPFRRSAEALRLHGRLESISLPMDLEGDQTRPPSPLEPAPAFELPPADMLDLALDSAPVPAGIEPAFEAPLDLSLDAPFADPLDRQVDSRFESAFAADAAPAPASVEPMAIDFASTEPAPAPADLQPAEAAFDPGDGLDISFDLDLPAPDAPESSAVAAPVSDAPVFDLSFELPEAAPQLPDAGAMVEIEGIDLESLAALSGQPPQPAALTPPTPDVSLDFDLPLDAGLQALSQDAREQAPLQAIDLDFGLPPQTGAGADAAQSAADEGLPAEEPQGSGLSEAPAGVTDSGYQDALVDDQVKVIGDLRIGLPLYNVYLNEADEWSRRLLTELTEWSLELHRPLPDAAIALAHSLAGSSGTVGFEALSGLARLLEHALQYARSDRVAGKPEHAALFMAAADDIQRLLHQFAAGFLKHADPQVLHELHELMASPVEREAEAAASAFDPLPATDALPSDSELAALEQVLHGGDALPVGASVPEPEPEPEPEPVASLHADEAELGPRGTQLEESGQVGRDVVDPDLFPIFEEEAAELLPQLGGALRQWAARPENLSARSEALRALHTLKGSARLAGAMRVGDMAHVIESRIEQIGGDAASTSAIEPLLGRFDLMQAEFDALREGTAQTSSIELPISAPPAASTLAEPGDAAAPLPVPASAGRILAPSASTFAARTASNQVVRVRSQLLDRMVNQAGEVMITRTRLEAELAQLRGSLGDLTGNLDRLRQQLRDIELQAESQMQTRLAQAKDSASGFDPLEFDRFTRVQELTRMMAESVNDVATVQRTLQRTVESSEDALIAQARQTRELQRDLLRTRMVEFDGISERLYRLVRQSAKEAGKIVRLDISGGSIELDRGVLERMTPAFEHLLRNCVAHGIEPAAVRSAAGKEPGGQISIELSQSGNDVTVAFQDDGGGLDLAAITAKARAAGLVPPDRDVTPQDAAALIFTPGFSTARTVTELSGRGIGMDVVRSEVNALGGRIETSSTPGRGTRFSLILPLTTAVTQVVMLRAGTASVGVPANLVESVRRATLAELQQAYRSGSFEYAGEAVPFYWAGALLQVSSRSEEAAARTIPVVIFRSAAQRLALHVDEVLGNQEVVVKNLGPQLSRLPGLSGMTVLASGAVAMMYNPVALAAVYGEAARRLTAEQAQTGAQPAAAQSALPLGTDTLSGSRIPLVMVVDDSITVRRVTQRLLLREGYRVVLAADGLQALEKLQEERPTVVLSDIEMPRMDGFDLARNIRADARLRELPIVMITSRMAAKHREHALELGVNDYLGKPYSEEELLRLVRQYSAAAVSDAG